MSSGIFSGGKLYFRFLMLQNGLSRFPANFKKISESQIFDISRDQTSHRAKISHFQNMLGFIQYGSRLFGIDASSDPAKFQDDWQSESRSNVQFLNRKLANLTNEKDEFAIAIFRHFSPLAPPPRHTPKFFIVSPHLCCFLLSSIHSFAEFFNIFHQVFHSPDPQVHMISSTRSGSQNHCLRFFIITVYCD